MSSTSDDILIQKIKLGDTNAFEQLYDKYSAAINGILFKILNDEEQANDILQETFVKVWTNIKDYNSSKGTLFTWILNIARNKAIDLLRKKSTSNEIRNTVSNVNFNLENHQTTFSVDAIGIKEMINQLKPELQIIIHLTYFKGYTQEEIAEELKIPLGTVKTRVRSAMQELKNLIL